MDIKTFNYSEWISQKAANKNALDEKQKNSNNEWLAWYIDPEGKGTYYYKEDLQEEENVVAIFDYCQIFLAIINNRGWEFLINHYSLQKLYELDLQSGWNDCKTIEEYEEFIKCYI